MHKRPATDKFMSAVRKWRARNASEDRLIGAAWELYPDKAKDRANRSRFLRACQASEQSFRRADEAAKRGGNIVDIVGLLERRSIAGAPKGNLNARGKRRDHSLSRINNAWRALPSERQNEFLRLHNLQRIS